MLSVAMALQAIAAEGWGRLSELHPGDRITVAQTGGKRQRGEFVNVTATGLSIRTASGESAIPRTDVDRVQSAGKAKLARNAAIGGGIGVAIAVTTDKTLGARLYNEGGYSSGAKAATWIIPIAAGAAIGLLTGRNPTIYRR